MLIDYGRHGRLCRDTKGRSDQRELSRTGVGSDQEDEVNGMRQ